MFSNKFLLLKITIALSTVTLLSYHSRDTFNTRYPDFITCQAMPSKYNGSKVIIDAERVIDVQRNYFVVERNGFTIKVNGGQESPEKNDVVTVLGQFNRNNFVEVINIKIHKYYLQKRFLMYAISIVTLVVLLFFLNRTFSISLLEGLFVSRRSNISQTD